MHRLRCSGIFPLCFSLDVAGFTCIYGSYVFSVEMLPDLCRRAGYPVGTPLLLYEVNNLCKTSDIKVTIIHVNDLCWHLNTVNHKVRCSTVYGYRGVIPNSQFKKLKKILCWLKKVSNLNNVWSNRIMWSMKYGIINIWIEWNFKNASIQGSHSPWKVLKFWVFLEKSLKMNLSLKSPWT